MLHGDARKRLPAIPAPELIEPPNGATLQNNRVTLRWMPVSGAVEYVVFWPQPGETYPSWAWVSAAEKAVTWSRGTTLEWWVWARSDYAYGATSPVWQFAIAP